MITWSHASFLLLSLNKAQEVAKTFWHFCFHHVVVTVTESTQFGWSFINFSATVGFAPINTSSLSSQKTPINLQPSVTYWTYWMRNECSAVSMGRKCFFWWFSHLRIQLHVFLFAWLANSVHAIERSLNKKLFLELFFSVLFSEFQLMMKLLLMTKRYCSLYLICYTVLKQDMSPLLSGGFQSKLKFKLGLGAEILF